MPAIHSTWNKIKGEVPLQSALTLNPVNQFDDLAIQSNRHNWARERQVLYLCFDNVEVNLSNVAACEQIKGEVPLQSALTLNPVNQFVDLAIQSSRHH